MTPHTTLPDSYTELLQGFAFGVGSTVIRTTGHKRSRIRLLLASFSGAFLKIGIQSSWLWSDAYFSSAFGTASGLVVALTASSQDRVSCERPYRARSNGATGRAVKCRSRQLQSLRFEPIPSGPAPRTSQYRSYKAVAVILSTGLKAAVALLAFVFLAHVVPYALDNFGLRQYPGPLLAKLSDIWLGWYTAHGKINQAVWDAHRAYGPIVRIAPNHVSVADASALHQIYGHSTGILKADLYDAFVSFNRTSIFSTRSREEHARKRKILAHTFSQKTTLEFEPVVRQYIGDMFKQWDRMCAAAVMGKGGVIGEMPWKDQDGRAEFDTLKWYNFMVFDIIGDLVFRAPFSMTERGTDMARIVKRPEKAMSSYESADTKLEYDTINAIEAVNARSAFLITLGVLPALWRPLIKTLPLPWVRAGTEAFQKITKLTVTVVADRSHHTATRNDILAKYFDATDENGQKLDAQELSSEAITLLIAGTDTTSNSVAAMTFYIAHNPVVQARLQAELDEALGSPVCESREEPVLATYEQIKGLSYLQDVVNEGLRVFSTVGLGLPRIVPDGGLTVLGRTLSPGTVVSVPTYVLNRDKSIWGDDAEYFNPDRWANGNKAAMLKAFAPFSTGPRACIGRNFAFMELLLVVANVFHRYEVVPGQSEPTMEVREGFLRKPLASTVAFKRRGAAV